MKRIRHTLLAATLLLAGMICGSIPMFAQPPAGAAELLAQADKDFAEKSFKQAGESYAAYIRHKDAADKPRAQLNLAYCQQKLEGFDDALYTLAAVAKEQGHSLWSVKAYRQRFFQRLAMPSWFTLHEGRRYWGRYVAQAPYHDGSQENRKDILESVRKAMEIMSGLAPAEKGNLDDVLLLAQIKLEAADIIEGDDAINGWEEKEIVLKKADGKSETFKERVRTWPHRAEILKLYDDAEALYRRAGGMGAPKETVLRGGLALYRKAMFITHVAEIGGYYFGPVDESVATLPPEADPRPLLREAMAKYPESRRAPEAWFALAVIERQLGRYVECLKELAALRAAYPRTKWVTDAQGVEQSIKAPRLGVSAPTSVAVGANVEVKANSRNIAKLDCRLHRFDLAGLMNDRAFKADAGAFLENMGAIKNYMQLYVGDQVRNFTVETQDNGAYQYQHHTINVELPANSPGAYVLMVSANNINVNCLMVATNKALVVKPSAATNAYWMVDSATGAPVPNATYLFKEHFYYWNGSASVGITTYQSARGDESGVATRAKSIPPPVNNPSSQGVTTLAIAADGAFAVTNTAHAHFYSSDWQNQTRVSAYTDRPIYRPGQTVNWRAIARQFKNGDYSQVANKEVRMIVQDPRGQRPVTKTLTLSEFGTINDSFAIPADAALGNWRVHMRIGESGATSVYFSVEEYKKPEYEVTVAPATDELRLGRDAEALVTVATLAGSPIPKAKAEWTVSVSWASGRYRYWRENEWFYQDYLGGRDYGYGGRHIATGTSETDASGQFKVAFKTTLPEGDDKDATYSYTVSVKVTDESRREVSGSGVVTASRFGYLATLGSARSVYTPGDRATLDLHTETPSGKPVAVAGKLRLGRLGTVWATEKNEQGYENRVLKRIEDFFTDLPIATDATGNGSVKWTFDSSGWFVARYEGKDSEGVDISTTLDLFVAGPNDNLENTRFSHLQMAADQRVYKIGDTAYVVLAADAPNTYVLTSIETGVADAKPVLHKIAGRAKILAIPITKAHAPNFVVSAYAVRSGQVQEARLELYVLPIERMLNVTLTPSKPEYKPGEVGAMQIAVTDALGKPAVAQVGLSIIDTALYQLAADRTPDPRYVFHKRRRQIAFNMYSSLTFGSSQHWADGNTYKEYETHGMPEGFGWGGWATWTGADLNLRTQFLNEPQPELGFAPIGLESRAPGDGEPKTPKGAGDPDAGGRFGEQGRLHRHIPRQGGSWGYGEDGEEDPSNGDIRKGFNSSVGLGGGGGPGARGVPQADGGNVESPKPAGDPGKLGSNGKSGGEMAEVQVRANFADTAFCKMDLTTNADGKVSAIVKYPDDLTRWRGIAVAVDAADRMGFATIHVRTQKNVLIRQQAPRFFVETDEVVLTAVVENNLAEAKDIRVSITLPEQLKLVGGSAAEVSRLVSARGRDQVNWRVRVVGVGAAKVRMTAQSDVESDAHELTFPAVIHGAPITTVQGGVLAGDRTQGAATIFLPQESLADRTRLRISVNPTVANTALEALPYLIEYPYGCVEQTMSRFLPAVVMRQTLADLGLNLEQIGAARKAKDLSAYPVAYREAYQNSPVFDTARLNDIVRVGLKRLFEMQNADGGFTWFPGGQSDPYMTAYVVHGLLIARAAKADFDMNRLARAARYLFGTFSKIEELHAAAFMAYVVTQAMAAKLLGEPGDASAITAYAEKIYAKRENLSCYGRALLLLTLNTLGKKAECEIVIRNLEGYAREDKTNGTAWFSDPGGWSWWQDNIEESAWAIRALIAAAPKHPLTRKLVTYLVNSREGAYWHSTKTTAFAILALLEFAKAEREIDANYTLEISLDGKLVHTVAVNRDSLFTLQDFIMDGAAVKPGGHTVQLVRKGMGTAYFAAQLDYFSLEPRIPRHGDEIQVARKYFKIVPKKIDHPNGASTIEIERVELADGAELLSGDKVEVELVIESKNNYEYMLFEDPKPAGCEAVSTRSGSQWEQGVWMYVEYRDQKVCMFVPRLPQGKIRLTYLLRAEIPGCFHALPSQSYAMYAPKLRANSDEATLKILDRK